MAGTALIVGVGDGISASFARLLAKDGVTVGLAARRPEKLEALRAEIDAITFGCDVTESGEVERLFAEADERLGALDVVHYNPSYRTQGPFVDLDPEEVRKTLMVGAYGGFLVAQAAARRMLRQGQGAILFTGASASVKGYARSAPFAMAKFALRGLAQSLARELAPRNIHIAHFVIDGGVRSARRPEPADRPDSLLDPDAIAASYLAVLRQPRSAWSWEVELRPWVEAF
jgi:NAD(P)-dependent dehydrogenase (short-subunit alcohol dehydrogenase family)